LPSSWWGEYLGSWPCCIFRSSSNWTAQVQRLGLQRRSPTGF
jgi:hypothetical protein